MQFNNFRLKKNIWTYLFAIWDQSGQIMTHRTHRRQIRSNCEKFGAIQNDWKHLNQLRSIETKQTQIWNQLDQFCPFLNHYDQFWQIMILHKGVCRHHACKPCPSKVGGIEFKDWQMNPNWLIYALPMSNQFFLN